MSEEQQPDQINQTEKRKQGRRSGGLYFPAHSLQEAIRIPRAIWDYNAGNPFPLLDLAKKLNYSPSSSGFRMLIRSSLRYALTEGSWQQDYTKTISLTALGSSIVAPTESDDVGVCMREALENPRIFKKINELLNGRVLPPSDVLKNTLVRNLYLSKPDAEACYKVLMKNAQELKIIDDVQGKEYYRIDNLAKSPVAVVQRADKTSTTTETEITTEPKIPEPQKLKQIFVAHGKNTKPLEQLKTILDQFRISYKVSVDEPNKGRPVGQKVSDLMHECSSAIFIFTKDEETKDVEENIIYRPSDNVVFELGAASVLYGNKIVIFKEEGVSFGTDFKSLGYISFDTDQLDSKTMDLMKELVGFGLLTVSVA